MMSDFSTLINSLLNPVVFPAVHPQPQTAPPSALIPVLTAVAPQPGMPGNTHAFQVRVHHISHYVVNCL